MARILIAEDEGAVRAFLIRAMESQDYEVKAVADGMQALQQLGFDLFDRVFFAYFLQQTPLQHS